MIARSDYNHCSLARWLLPVLAIVACLAPRPAAAQGPPPAPVRVDPARLEKVQDQRMVTGELRPVRKARVATQEPGLVLEITVEEGQIVKKGDPLARLDRKRLEIELQNIQAQEQVARASVDEQQAQLSWRQRDLETYRSAAQRQASNPKELSDAEAQAAIAAAKLAAAQQQIIAIRAQADLVAKRLADTLIIAPFDGVVVVKHVEQGEWVAEGAAVIDLISTGPIDAWLDVPQQYAAAIIGKQPTVSINVEATGEVLASQHVRSIPQVDSKARSFAMIVRLDNPNAALAAGMSITGWVPTGQAAEQLTISKDALLRNDVGAYVYVARSGAPGAPSSATPANVQILFALKDRFVVKSQSIAPGDLIIVEGNERLFPMAPVIPNQAEAAAEQKAQPAGSTAINGNAGNPASSGGRR